MDFQSVKSLTIPEGEVKTIHDKDNNLLWGAVGYGVKYAGNIAQQSYSGFQLLKKNGLATDKTDTSFWENISSELTITPLGNGWARITASSNTSDKLARILRTGGFEWEASATYTVILEVKNAPNKGAFSMAQPQNAADPFSSVDGDPLARFNGSDYTRVFKGLTKSNINNIGLRAYFYGSFSNVSVDLRLTIISGDHTNDYQNYCGNNWQPYVGGIASPNPDYPQDIQVVTGEQTVSITDGTNTQNFTVGLGSIELAKIGSYQDYIYKSGDDWYVHKAVAKVILNSSLNFGEKSSSVTTANRYRTLAVSGGVPNKNLALLISNYNLGITNDQSDSGSVGVALRSASGIQEGLFFSTPLDMCPTLTDFNTWIDANQPTVYYALATASDTKITDATLISQLDAVHEWLSRYGYNATVTGNLPLIVDRINL